MLGLAEVLAPAPAPVPRTESPESVPAPGAAHVASVADARGARVERAEPTPEPNAAAVETSARPRDGGDAAPTTNEPQALVITGPRSMDALGIGGRNPLFPKSEAEVEAAEQKRLRDRTLRDPARERELALGLGPEGPVLRALSEATSQSTAPVKGRAVFVAKTGPSGEVESIELHDAEGGRGGWAEAGRLALEALRGKKLRLSGGTTRAVMRLEVTSAVKLPSGHDPGTELTIFHVPVTKGEGKDSTKVRVLQPEIGVADIPIAPGVVLKMPYFSMTILGTNGDLVDIANAARRVVHTRVLETTVM